MCAPTHVSGKGLEPGGGSQLTLCSGQLQSTVKDEARKTMSPPSRLVSGCLGFEYRNYISLFILISTGFTVRAMTLEKWTKELDWPMQATGATCVCAAMKPDQEVDGDYQSPVSRDPFDHSKEKGPGLRPR